MIDREPLFEKLRSLEAEIGDSGALPARLFTSPCCQRPLFLLPGDGSYYTRYMGAWITELQPNCLGVCAFWETPSLLDATATIAAARDAHAALMEHLVLNLRDPVVADDPVPLFGPAIIRDGGLLPMPIQVPDVSR